MGDSVTAEILGNMIRQYFSQARTEDEEGTIQALNHLRKVLHEVSPFAREPVDCVLWVKADDVVANDYNPNVMAPGEKKLLKQSLKKDGFTQPLVVSEEKSHYLVVDGFHRQLLSREADTGKRLKGWLPVACINQERKGQASRIAATIRHNRARGKHQITSMSDIVRDLSRLGWTDERIGAELGMDQDEVLRLKQISGLTELFQEADFSTAWTVR
ncbi:ParB/RepB/Spo0J family partition protein [Escherichia coli]|uniref:IbrB-like domain-containing protein n=1 Tax=Escherichia coli TaxID=562 RepID=UPI000B7FE583|nr:ParB/RepB/Spo0J family partition protein [Escherichia coli]EFA4174750.1 ParB-like nuclease domain-containing protein [Escherichia coli O163]EHE1706523.1 ParB-like nuclease domain-containing protein [Salmonella enterica]EEV7009121.1 transcriptional regulator [Escherichia coli]EFA4846648.1 transcriptional regulator [Escherichia coli]EFB2815876.1 transcriptional regulator [Escherichia coli]